MNKDTLPKISVIVPVFNSVKTIEKALRSILDQNYANTEIIVIDAGSTDGTVEIIKRYELSIYYWHSKPDGSCGLAINLGLQQATGELTAQLMADDWFEPNTFDAIGQAFVENNAADIISCGGRIVCFDKKRQQYKALAIYVSPKQLTLDVHNMCFGLPAMSSRFITKKLLDKMGLMIPFDKNGKHNFSADRELLLRAAIYQCKNVIINHLGHTYLAHAGSATFSNNRNNQLKIYQEHMAIVENYIAKYDMSAQVQSWLLYWYNDQSVRLLIYKLFAGEYRVVWHITKNGIKKSRAKWLIALFATPCKIASKKGYVRFMEIVKKGCYV
jgi:glycosyltransferase involved in cell wall biosynthesis